MNFIMKETAAVTLVVSGWSHVAVDIHASFQNNKIADSMWSHVWQKTLTALALAINQWSGSQGLGWQPRKCLLIFALRKPLKLPS